MLSCNPIRNSASQFSVGATGSSGGSDNFNEVLRIFNVSGSGKCFQCHSGWSKYSEKDYIDFGLVVAGNPDASLIYKSLSEGGIPDGIMPPASQGTLSNSEKEKIKKWIEEMNKFSTEGSTNGGSSGSSSPGDTLPPPPADEGESSEFKAFYEVVQRKCIWCHDLEDEYPNSPNFRMPSSDAWVNSGMVIPKDPTASPFYNSILDDEMPPNNLAKVSSADKNIIEAYINSLEGVGNTTSSTMGENPGQVRWEAARDVFRARCTSCHRNLGRDFIVSNTSTEQDLIDQTNYIVPGMADQSDAFLWIKGSGGSPASMPTNSDISTEEVEAIRDWINGL